MNYVSNTHLNHHKWRLAAKHYQRKKDYMNYKVMLAKILSEKELADIIAFRICHQKVVEYITIII